MHSQPARGHASDGWNQHYNNKSTECTHSVVYECGGGGGGSGERGGEWGRGSFTYILLLLLLLWCWQPPSIEQELLRDFPVLFFFFSTFFQFFPNNGHNTREKLFVGTTAKQTLSQVLSPHKLRVIFSLARISIIAPNGVFASCWAFHLQRHSQKQWLDLECHSRKKLDLIYTLGYHSLSYWPSCVIGSKHRLVSTQQSITNLCAEFLVPLENSLILNFTSRSRYFTRVRLLLK